MELCHVYQLTHSQENILDLQWLDSNEMNPDELEAVARNMVAHLRHLLDQRDTHLEVCFTFLGSVILDIVLKNKTSFCRL